jgi:hypothetical protein
MSLLEKYTMTSIALRNVKNSLVIIKKRSVINVALRFPNIKQRMNGSLIQSCISRSLNKIKNMASNCCRKMERMANAPSAMASKTLNISPNVRNANRVFVVHAMNQGCSKNVTLAKIHSAVPLCTHYRFVSLAFINLNCL